MSRFRPKEFSLEFLDTYMDPVQDILKEIERANAKHGTPDHPSIDNRLRPNEATAYYQVPSQKEAKYLTDSRFANGLCTHADITLEEFCEALEAKDDTERRQELVQLAAVVIKWIKNIDQRNEAIGFYEKPWRGQEIDHTREEHDKLDGV